MTYTEILRIRHMLFVVLIIVIACDASGILAILLGGHGKLTLNFNGAEMTVGQALARHKTTIPLAYMIVIALFVASIVATIVGCALGRENETIASTWTKPVSRFRLALGYVGVDIAGILGAATIVLVAGGLAMVVAVGAAPLLVLGDVGGTLLWSVGFVFAIYGTSLLLTAWPERSFLGAYLLWPVGLVLYGFVGREAYPLRFTTFSLRSTLPTHSPISDRSSVSGGHFSQHASLMPLSFQARVVGLLDLSQSSLYPPRYLSLAATGGITSCNTSEARSR